MSTPSEILIAGYIRDVERENKHISIPTELLTIIILFYPKQYKLYGIGKPEYIQFGATYISEAKWQYLPQISSICRHPSLISKGYSNLRVIDSQNNELYGIGRNQYGSLAQIKAVRQVPELSKIDFEDINHNHYSLDLMNDAVASHFVFIVFKHNDDPNDQFIYSSGDNQYYQQGYPSEDNYAPVQATH